MDDVEIDKRARRRIEELLHIAQPRYSRTPGSPYSLEELLAGAPPPDLFRSVNHLLARDLGIDLTRETPSCLDITDVCVKSPTDLLLAFLEASYVFLGQVPERAISVTHKEYQSQLNRIFNEHEIPIHMEQGILTTSSIDSYTPTHLEEKFGVLLGPKYERSDFEMLAGEAKAEGIPIAVLFVDIDDFKRLNSTYTETEVDRSILPDAQNLLRALTLKRAKAYRHGGEEFVVIAPNQSLDEAMCYAERIRSTYENTSFSIAGKNENITVSIGVALWPMHGTEYQDVLQAANLAEKTAKAQGRNCVCAYGQGG